MKPQTANHGQDKNQHVNRADVLHPPSHPSREFELHKHTKHCRPVDSICVRKVFDTHAPASLYQPLCLANAQSGLFLLGRLDDWTIGRFDPDSSIHCAPVRFGRFLPLSLLPPTMICYTDESMGDVFVPGVTPAQWHVAAGIFFLAELFTGPIMVWLIHLVARVNNAATDYCACFTLAAIAPVPMWLSSLILFVPNPSVCVVLHARRYQGVANGNSDCQRWTVHVADTDADCPDPLTTTTPWTDEKMSTHADLGSIWLHQN